MVLYDLMLQANNKKYAGTRKKRIFWSRPVTRAGDTISLNPESIKNKLVS
jgi:hypothetical protein